MKQRIISTVLLWGLIVATIYFGGATGATILVLIAACATQWECYRLMEKMGFSPKKEVGLIAGVAGLTGTYLSPNLPGYDLGSAVFAIVFIGLLLTTLARPSIEYIKERLQPTLLGILLVPFMLQFFLRILYWDTIGHTQQGMFLCVWLIAVAKFSDVGGLLIGKAIGKNKLAPSISPGKTWEGVVGGIALSTLVGVVLVVTCGAWVPEIFNMWHAVIIAPFIAATAVASDLLESVIKRLAGVKDSGNLIPGIGGAFDLTDSILLSVPVGYFLMKMVLFIEWI